MPFVKIYIHFVWSTKNRTPFLNSADLRKEVWKHIKENSVQKKSLLIASMATQNIAIA
jgi:putative transposase